MDEKVEDDGMNSAAISGDTYMKRGLLRGNLST